MTTKSYLNGLSGNKETYLHLTSLSTFLEPINKELALQIQFPTLVWNLYVCPDHVPACVVGFPSATGLVDCDKYYEKFPVVIDLARFQVWKQGWI